MINVLSFVFCLDLFLASFLFCASVYLSGITLSFKCSHQLSVHLIVVDEWAGDIQVNGQLVKTTVIGNVETEIKKQRMSFPQTDRGEIGSLGKLGRK